MSVGVFPNAAPDLTQLRKSYADLAAYADIRLVTLSDGTERGVRVLELRAGGGLELEVIVDRGFDLGRLAINGVTVSWHCPNGYRAPWLLDSASDRAQGFLRANNGFLSTCGLDHIRQPETDILVDQSCYPDKEMDYPLHGHGAHQPARLISYGVEEEAEYPYLWCEGEIVQTMQFNGTLKLRRRIEVPLGGGDISIHDRVVNRGPTVMSHMMLYHFNIGHPLVSDKSRIELPNAQHVWGEGNPLAPYPEPQAEQNSALSVFAIDQDVTSGICTVSNSASGLELALEFDRKALPFFQLLRMTGQGTYGIGLEPCTAASRSRSGARAANEMLYLKPGEDRTYNINISLKANPLTQSET
ncbi:MAG: aldose 1-epimerase family protein [Hyphomicrobiales bacterium]